jgi:serine/threonine-protein kinase
MSSDDVPIRVGRYTLYDVLGRGGMATVHVGRFAAVGGFARTVAIKRLYRHVARDRALASRFFSEARLVTRIRHPNVVATLDVVVEGEECILVMEYVPGETLGRMLHAVAVRDARVPPRIASGVMSGVLHGLQAAHVAKDERGEPLLVVHRDVSPQNIIVGSDGIPRLLDFGIAKAVGQTTVTPGGQILGKISYLAPEQLVGRAVTASADVFTAAIVLWETLVGRRLFLDESPEKTVANALSMRIPRPSEFASELPRELDEVVLAGLAREPAKRFRSAREMAVALERAVSPASATEIAAWVEELAAPALAARAATIRAIEAARNDAELESLDPAMARDGANTRVGDGESNGEAPALGDAEATVMLDCGAGLASRRDRVDPAGRSLGPPPNRADAAARFARRFWTPPFIIVPLGIALLLAATATLIVATHRSSEAGPPPSADLEPALASAEDPASFDVSPIASASAAGANGSTPRALRGPRPRAHSTSRCSPPFGYDSAGHKVYKEECF